MTKISTSAYDTLLQQIQLSHNGTLTELEAHKIARNLMIFCEKLIDANSQPEVDGV